MTFAMVQLYGGASKCIFHGIMDHESMDTFSKQFCEK